MEIKVIREFVDKHTGVYYRVGSDYESSDEARIVELQEAGFLKRTPLPSNLVEVAEEEVEIAVKEASEDAKKPKRRRKR